MASRINIGPENGPYVAINESSGNLQLEDNSGNVVAEWDETNAQWDFANNTLNNVDALNSNSVNTEQLTSTDGSVFGTEIDTDNTSQAESDDLQVSVDDISDYSRLLLICECDPDTDDTVELVLNGDDDGGSYAFTLNDGTRKSDQDTWELFTCTDSMTGTFIIEFVTDRDSRPMPIRLGVTQRSSGSNRIDDMAVNFQGIPGSPGAEWDIGLRTVATDGDANVTLYGAEQ